MRHILYSFCMFSLIALGAGCGTEPQSAADSTLLQPAAPAAPSKAPSIPSEAQNVPRPY